MGKRDDGHSRRDFLKGVSTAATAGALIGGANGSEARANKAGGPHYGKQATSVRLTVNGKTVTVKVEPRTTLLDALREQLGLTGAKKGCDRGACGACTVLVDGKPQVGCLTLAVEAQGKAITTVEGVAADPANAALIDAFVKHDAAQCGFCIPGFVVSASALIKRNPKPSDGEVREALAGNMCRCGTQSKILDAMGSLAGRAALSTNKANRVAVSNDASRVDSRQKVTGAAKFTSDQYPKGMLYARLIRFPHGAGRVTASDLKAAKAVKGVLEVELEQKKGRYPGDVIGHIVATSEDAIEDGLAALALKVRPDGIRALASDYYKKPTSEPARLKALFASGKAVVESTYTTQVQTHSALETHGAVVVPQGDKATVFASTQSVMGFRRGIARHLGTDSSKVEVVSEYVGGGFGAKFSTGAEGRLAAKIATKYEKPVRVMLTRWEEHLDAGNRPGSIQYMKVSAGPTGKLLGARIHNVGVVGFRGGGGGVKNPLLYEFGDAHTTSTEIELTSGRPRAFRAPGHPQGVFAVESMMDELAAQLKMDPLKFREVNEKSATRKAQFKLAAKAIGWNRRKADGAWPGRLKRGFGCGGTQWYKWPTSAGAHVAIYRSGKVVASAGVQDIGTGTFTVVAETAAETLQLSRDMIEPRVGRSNYPPGPGSGGSQVSRSVAPAVVDASLSAVSQLRGVVAAAWGLRARDVRYGKGIFRGKGGKKATWKEACQLIRAEPLEAKGRVKEDKLGKGNSDGVQFAEVEVDTETGVVRVIKIVAVQACGKIVNRLATENQICGGVIQGLSYALFEDRRLDRNTGGMVNPNLEAYKIAGMKDIPVIEPILWMDANQTGVRGLGEPPTIPTAGAIANAVANAIGARVYDLPITPERVLAALARKRGKTP